MTRAVGVLLNLLICGLNFIRIKCLMEERTKRKRKTVSRNVVKKSIEFDDYEARLFCRQDNIEQNESR